MSIKDCQNCPEYTNVIRHPYLIPYCVNADCIIPSVCKDVPVPKWCPLKGGKDESNIAD